MKKNKIIKVAIVGNPNTGKTTLVNAIAGTSLKVGNWAGVTVEKKEAFFKYGNYDIHLIDLPGIYSLSNNSAEEKITIDYLLNEKPDVVINVLDSTTLEKNLYLTIQLLEMDLPLVLALNMCDEAKKKGLKVDFKKLTRIICVPSIPIVAKSGKGIDKLLEKALEIATRKTEYKRDRCKIRYNSDLEKELETISDVMRNLQPNLLNNFPKRFLVLSLLEGNSFFVNTEIHSEIIDRLKKSREYLEKLFNSDISTIVIEARYSIVLGIYEKVVKKEKIDKEKVDFALQLDKIFLHKYFAFPIFLLILWLIFNLTFELSTPYVDWLDSVLGNVIAPYIYYLLDLLNVSPLFKSFVIEGIIGGVGFVVVFVPVLFTLYTLMAILEESGYMSRVAFLMDRLMAVFGLNGKSFIPLIIGFGCNVPAVYATRTLENPKAKILTVLLIPFMSCGARLTVFVFFTTIFFKEHQALVLMFLYLLGVFIAGLVAILLHKFVLKSDYSEFILELPPYRVPNLRYTVKYSWLKTKSFLYEAGTFILATSIVIWFLLHIPFGTKKIEDSVFGNISKTIAPLFEPLGFGKWEHAGALISGFVAKEVVLATMGNIYAGEITEEKHAKPSLKETFNTIFLGFANANFQAITNLTHLINFKLIGEEKENNGDKSLINAVSKSFSPLSALSFMVFLLLYTPCMATVFAIKQELQSWRWTFISILISLSTAWIVSFIVYNIGKIVI